MFYSIKFIFLFWRYSVHGIQLSDRADQGFLHDLEHSLDLDMLQHGAPGVRDAYVMVAPEIAREFLATLDKQGLMHYLKVSDVSK